MTRIKKPAQRLLFLAFGAWIFLSAFYYAGNFISGDVLADRSSDQFHKAFKYAAALLFSLLFMLKFRLWSLLLYYVCLFFCLIMFLIIHFSGIQVQHAIDITIVLISFSGFVFFISKFDDDALIRTAKLVVASALIPSCISFFEYFFMEPILGDYWRNTGGYRSISTLLNPNNFGLYIGAAFLLLVFSDQYTVKRKIITLAIFLAALLMSGSRTALISLFTALLFGSVFSGNCSIRLNRLVGWLVAAPSTLAILTVAIYIFQFELPDRAINMETAFIRIAKYFEYVTNFNASYMIPDSDEERIGIVSENSYFHVMNSFGFLFFFLLALITAFFHRPDLSSYRLPAPRRIFRIVFAYYLVASFFENVLMSFPNNQLFFIAAGAVFAVRDFAWTNRKSISTAC